MHKLLLPADAPEVTALIAVANIIQGLLPVEKLLSGGNVDVQVLRLIVILQMLFHLHGHPAEMIDDLPEALVVNHDVEGDGDSQEVGDDPPGLPDSPQRVGCVGLVELPPGELQAQVTGDGD